MEQLFFQSSMPNAGSEVLQNILAQNPDIYTTPTSGLSDIVLAAREGYSKSTEFKNQHPDLVKGSFISFCTKGMETYYEYATTKKYVVDSSNNWGIHYDFLNLAFPNPKVICLLKDPRDIFADMESEFKNNPDKHPDILNWTTGQGITVPKRIDIWIQNSPVGLAFERLSEMFRVGVAAKVLFIKFEDLCLYPDTTMVKIYDYLNIPNFKHDFDSIGLEPVRSKAKEILGRDVTEWIHTNFKWYFDQFKYTK